MHIMPKSYYTPKQKESVLKKLLQPNAPSCLAYSKQIGISSPTLCRWLKEHKNKASRIMPKRPMDWSPEERLKALEDTSSLSEEEVGAYVRKNGITRLQIKEWRSDILQAIGARTGRKPDREKRDLKKENTQLKRELNRKEKSLAETAALLVLKKKADILWGEDEDS